MPDVYPEEEIRKFYKLLRHSLSTEIRTIGKNGVRSYHVLGEEEFVKKCLELDGKENIYAGIQEREKLGTTVKSVSAVRVIPFDFDPIREVGKAADEKSRSDALTAAFIFWSALRSNFTNVSLIFSGDGYHIYLPMEPILLTENNREQVVEAYRVTADNFLSKFPPPLIAKSDHVWDLARIMRVPGTINLKTGLRSHFIHYSTVPNVGLREQILSVKVEKSKTNFVLPPQVIHNIEIAKWIDRDMAKVLRGDFGNFPSRSEAEMSIVCKLVGFGFSDEEIDTIMRAHGMEKWSTANPKYRAHTFKKAKEWFVESKVFKGKERIGVQG